MTSMRNSLLIHVML